MRYSRQVFFIILTFVLLSIVSILESGPRKKSKQVPVRDTVTIPIPICPDIASGTLSFYRPGIESTGRLSVVVRVEVCESNSSSK